MRLGKLIGVIYAADHGEHYLHQFRGASRPTLVAEHDGTRLHIVGGKYRMTTRGIVDVGSNVTLKGVARKLGRRG